MKIERVENGYIVTDYPYKHVFKTKKEVIKFMEENFYPGDE